MEEGYYIPKIEELFVGYEYEMNDGYNWITQIFPKPWLQNSSGMGGFNTIQNSINEEGIRTKYLTKGQIEAEGFLFQQSRKYSEGEYIYFKDEKITLEFPLIRKCDDRCNIIGLSLWYCLQTNQLHIELKDNKGFDFCCYYDGECKSINEFRKILRLLNIK